MKVPKYILITLAFILVAAGIYWLFSTDYNNPQVEQSTEQQAENPASSASTAEISKGVVEVEFTEEGGFQPREVTIRRNQSVRFKVPADAEIPVWVASDPHPEHTGYSEFDAARILDALPSPGEGYEFVFEKVGSWAYHNHTQPSYDGVVNVIE